MATLTNSSIHDWLRFDGSVLPNLLSCQDLNLTTVSCSEVCNDSLALFTPSTNNLVTCGLWTSLVSVYTYLDQKNDSLILRANNSTDNLLPSFEHSGLVAKDYQNAPLYADTISNCLETIYLNVKQYSFADDGQVPAACTKDDLFPFGTRNYGSSNDSIPDDTEPTTDSLKNCLKSICEPLTINPDLAGVGVFWSFVIQSGIAILSLAALLIFELYYHLKRIKDRIQIDRLIIALVDFHKAQCYFAGVIQVTALALFHKSKNGSAAAFNDNYADPKAFRDLFDSSVLIFLATSGLIPINLTLACITRYGRQSWYLLILSFITTTLASATLIGSYVYAYDYGKSGFYENNLASYFNYYNLYGGDTTATCYIDGPLDTTLIPLCGNANLAKNQLPDSTIANWWSWLIYANCMLWLLFSFGRKYFDSEGRSKFRKTLTGLYLRHTWVQSSVGWIAKEKSLHPAWILISVIPWSLCFAAQFYLFDAYFRHEVISSTWGFGQIIAVTVWVPSIVEYLYLQWNGIEKGSKYKYPSPLMVMRHVARSSVSLANLQSPEIHKEDDDGFMSAEPDDSFVGGRRYHDAT